MSSTTFSAFGSVAARASAPSTTTAAPPAATSVGRCTRSPVEGACSRHKGRKSGTTDYARAIYENSAATLDDLREAVATLEDTERIARRVLGGAHPITAGIENQLRYARAALRARETPSPPPGSA